MVHSTVKPIFSPGLTGVPFHAGCGAALYDVLVPVPVPVGAAEPGVGQLSTREIAGSKVWVVRSVTKLF